MKNTNEIVSSYVSILALIELLKDKGVPMDKIEKVTGLDPSQMDSPDLQLPLGRFVKLWQLAVDVTRDRALAFHLREKYQKNTINFAVAIAANSKNLLEALNHWCRYAGLICSADRFEYREEKDQTVILYAYLAAEYWNIWIVEHNLLQVLRNAREMTSTDLNPIWVHFQHSDPGYANEYHKYFRCPVLFDQDENRLIFKKSDLMRPIMTGNTYLQSALKDYAEMLLLESSGKKNIQGRVCECIIKELPLGILNVELVAEAMHMHRSTLLRKLKEEGTTYTDLLEQTRKQLAQNYLKQSLSVNQIAYLLGYTQSSSLQHACKRWFGKTPGKMRQEIVFNSS